MYQQQAPLPCGYPPVNCIELHNVTKAYSTKVAVQDVTLNVPAGTVFGLLGPNGAGKTSLIRMITHITMPDSGRILFNGEPLTEAHQARMGYMPEERGLYKKMPVYEQLLYLMQLRGMKTKAADEAIDKWLTRFELNSWRKRKTDELSKGMQQKIQFIATVAHNPPLLILDEPFSGLDPINAQLLEQVMLELKAQGTTVIFSTHRMEQVEEFCDRIALINNARIVLEDDVKAARHRYRKSIYTLESEHDFSTIAIPEMATVLERTPHRVKVQLPDGLKPAPLIAYLNERIELSRFELYLPSLRDIFIEVVEKSNSPATSVPLSNTHTNTTPITA